MIISFWFPTLILLAEHLKKRGVPVRICAYHFSIPINDAIRKVTASFKFSCIADFDHIIG